MTPPDKYRTRTLYQALHLEKQVSLALAKALRAQMIENEVLKERIEELEKGGCEG